GFSRIPLMQWAAPEYSSEQDKIQSLSQRMEKLRLHYRKVEKQVISPLPGMGASPYPVTTALSTPESITALSFFLSCSASRSAR
ncbi:hypothetical protein ACSLOG_27465, partial [Escherichia coli]|uniref:hypothetical protein n=1 Tax=Escherichia coli TaxID=562 RepID=UPI003EE2D175